jgi:hypothetical protein
VPATGGPHRHLQVCPRPFNVSTRGRRSQSLSPGRRRRPSTLAPAWPGRGNVSPPYWLPDWLRAPRSEGARLVGADVADWRRPDAEASKEASRPGDESRYGCSAMSPTSTSTPVLSLRDRSPTCILRVAVAAATVLIAVLLGGSQALAAGSFSLKTPSVDEKGAEWHVKVRIDLARPPGMMHTPMRFTFSKEAVDERAIMSKGAEPEHHRTVLDTPPKQIVSLDVDFADASGRVFKSTYFEFDLARKDGYFEAGEYLVTLSGSDGEVGSAQKLMLKGDNPPVYRGAMDFTTDVKAQKKKGPKIESVSSGLDGGGPQSEGENNPSSAGPASTDVAPSGPAPDMVPQTAYNHTSEEEAVQDHPKGCGCRAAGLEQASVAGGTMSILSLGLIISRRRRRR